MNSVAPEAKIPILNEQELTEAFRALQLYQSGSPRGSLVPIDEAVERSQDAPESRAMLERRFISILEDTSCSPLAREYACSKLTLIGSRNSVTALAGLLSNPGLSGAARNALEQIDDVKAAAALRASLSQLAQPQMLGVVNSLGARRDPESVRELRKLLRSSTPELVSAAASALGEIGSAKAAAALRALMKKTSPDASLMVADACLACAENLLRSGRNADARALYEGVLNASQADWVRAAAQAGLKRCAPRS